MSTGVPLHASRYLQVLLNGRVHTDNALIGDTGVIQPQAVLRPEGTKVAVKICRCACTRDQQANELVLREVQILALLQHKNVLPILGIVTEFSGISGISIVTPWKKKGNAHDYVQNETIDPRSLLRGIANGLFYLHHHNSGPIVHGNLKGTNVLISDDGSPQVTDICCSFTSLPGTEITSAILCAPRWTAPERLNDGGEANAKGDVWAFGMTALELLTRKLPFNDILHRQGVIVRVLKGPPDRPSDESTLCRMTDDWWNMCSKCWEVDTLSRPQISEILDLIETIK